MALPHLTIYAHQSSPRLKYVLDWLFCARLGFNYSLTSSPEEAIAAQHCITYGFVYGAKNAVEITAGNLLWETNIDAHFLNRKTWQGLHALYFDDDADCDIPFDIISGIFYLLTRYEEYIKPETDRHGRFPYTASILDFDGMLERPIVDEWVEHLRQLLEQRWSISIPKNKYTFEATYDIDIAWKYRNKGLKRYVGAALRDVATFQLPSIPERFSEKDPWDAYGWLQDLHNRTGIKPRTFVLAAQSTTAFDKNISPSHPQMQTLIRRLAAEAEIGLHPSYLTKNDREKIIAEKSLLESITGKPVTISRQHFIRLFLPHTYRDLIAAGITDDYSMGYGTHTGFRAGTSHSFLWYDLANEETTALHIHPFCFMDTTAHYDLKLSPSAAFERLRLLEETLQKLGGRLTTIFHNFSLGTDIEWRGWRQAYEEFVLQQAGDNS